MSTPAIEIIPTDADPTTPGAVKPTRAATVAAAVRTAAGLDAPAVPAAETPAVVPPADVPPPVAAPAKTRVKAKILKGIPPRAQREIDRLNTKLAKADKLQAAGVATQAVMREFVANELAQLGAGMQAYVKDVAGDDPARQYTTLQALRKHDLATPGAGAPKAPAKLAIVPPAGRAPVAPPAKLATTVAAPGPATPRAPGTLSAWDTWQSLVNRGMSKNAAMYQLRNAAAIAASKPA